MDFTPTDEQQAVIEALKGHQRINVQAYAGCGKTTTLRLLAETSPRTSFFYTAFNKAIVETSKASMPRNVECRTTHSMSFSYADRRRLGFTNDPMFRRQPGWEQAKVLDVGPYTTVVDGKSRRLAGGWLAAMGIATLRRWCDSADMEIGRQHVVFPRVVIEDTTGAWVGAREQLAARAIGIAQRAWQDVLDPGGRLRWDHGFYLKMYQMAGEYPRTGVILLDEAQDTNGVTMAILDNAAKAGTQIVLVGDPYQEIYCQPPGTMVSTAVAVGGGRGKGGPRWEGVDVPIERLAVGQRVVSYDIGGSRLRRSGSPVARTESRRYSGRLATVACDGRATRMTADHHVVVKMGAGNDGRHVVYLMCRNGAFRVGRVPWRYATQNGIWGPGQRAAQEGADALWVLGVYDTQEDAAHHEAILSARYGVPMLCFRPSASHAIDVDRFWDAFGPESAVAAKALLDDMGLLTDHPLWGQGQRVMMRRPFVTRAANLVDGMEMAVVDRFVRDEAHRSDMSWDGAWQPIAVTWEHYSGPVVSISVERDHTYVADGIVTHNSWRGAVNAMDKGEKDITCHLTGSWRFGKALADAANLMLVDTLGATRPLRGLNANPGVVGPAEGINAVLGRTNGGVMAAAMELQKSGLKVKVMGGTDEVARFVRAAMALKAGRPVEHPDLGAFETWAQVQEYVDMDPGGEDLKLLVDMIDDPAIGPEALIALAENAPRNPDVVLSTGHKAKGLEWPTVRLLQDFKGPERQRQPVLPGQQHDNPADVRLLYVAATRAQEHLDCFAVPFMRQHLKSATAGCAWLRGRHNVAPPQEPPAGGHGPKVRCRRSVPAPEGRPMPLANINIAAQLAAVQTNAPSAQDLATTVPASFPLSAFKQATLVDGTGAGAADRLFSDRRTISANDDLDLAGSLVDAMGTTITFARIRGIWIAAADANAGNIIIGAGTNPWATFLNAAGTATLKPGGFVSAYAGNDAAGWTVTATTGDILRIGVSAGTLTYDIAILGCSA